MNTSTRMAIIAGLGALLSSGGAAAQATAPGPVASGPTAPSVQSPASAAACSAAAKAAFNKAHPKPQKTVKGHERLVTYKTSFSAASKSCYLLEEIVLKKPDGATARVGRKLMQLDGAQNQQIGRFVGPDKPVQCEFSGKPCADAAEWSKLAQARMKQ